MIVILCDIFMNNIINLMFLNIIYREKKQFRHSGNEHCVRALIVPGILNLTYLSSVGSSDKVSAKTISSFLVLAMIT